MVSLVFVVIGFLSLVNAQGSALDWLMGISTNGTNQDEYDLLPEGFNATDQYDLLESEEGFNDTVTVSTEEAATTLLLAQIEQLKKETWEKEEEIEQLNLQVENITKKFSEDIARLTAESKRQHEALVQESKDLQEALIQTHQDEKAALVEKSRKELEALVEDWKNEKTALIEERNETVQDHQRRKKQEKAKCDKALTNKDVLIRFLSYRLMDKDKRSKISRKVIEAQNEKLRVLGEERKTYQEKNKNLLKHAFLNAEVIRRQEKQKRHLEDALTIDAKLQQGYSNLTAILQDNAMECSQPWMETLMKTTMDQEDEIRKLTYVTFQKLYSLTESIVFRSFSDEESKIEIHLVEALEEVEKLNVTFSTDTKGKLSLSS